VDKSRAECEEPHFRRDANLTAFFSKTIPVVLTSDLGKDFKLSCSEVIHRGKVDIRKMIAPLSPVPLVRVVGGCVPSASGDNLQLPSERRNKKKRRRGHAASTPFASCLPLTAYRLSTGVVIPGKSRNATGSRSDPR
jgi:hypothetical protein